MALGIAGGEFKVSPDFDAWLDARVEHLMDAVGEFYRDEVWRLMQSSPASGRIYVRRGRIHRASAPGQPPAPDTQTLIRGIDTEGSGSGFKHEVAVGVGGGGERYALALEFGTARILPRPAWLPALTNLRGRVLAAPSD